MVRKNYDYDPEVEGLVTVYKENQDYLLSRNRTFDMQDGSAENFLPS